MVMVGNWEYMKHKQIYFVEYEGQTIKFKGFDALNEWVKSRKEGDEWSVYFVGAIMKMSAKPTPQK